MRWALVLLLLACSGESEEDRCVFDGTYDIGFIARNGCQSSSESVFLRGEDECYTAIDQINLFGARQLGFLSCEPGDPVVECTGFVNDSDGCSFDAYVRLTQPGS